MTTEIRNPRTGQRLILTPSPAATLAANARQKAALKAKADAAKKLADEIQAEHKARADEEARGVRAHIRAVASREAPAEVVEVDGGPTRLLARDGLAWLVAKGRLNAAQRMAGERYRGLYATIHGGGLRSCIGDTTGSSAIFGGEDIPPLMHAQAREALEHSRRRALASDNTLIWLCDEVAGKGTTLRDLAADDQKRAIAFEAELLVALRFLAKHYGFAS